MVDEINYPECEFKARSGISSAVWRKQATTKDGRTFDKFSIKLQKRYLYPATGEWKGSELYLFPSEVHVLLTVAQRAYEHCMLAEETEDSGEAIPVQNSEQVLVPEEPVCLIGGRAFFDRWQQPMPPAYFLPIAQKMATIGKLSVFCSPL